MIKYLDNLNADDNIKRLTQYHTNSKKLLIFKHLYRLVSITKHCSVRRKFWIIRFKIGFVKGTFEARVIVDIIFMNI